MSILLNLFALCGKTQIEPQKIFGIDDGMPTTEIYDIETDNLGRMWFTSDRGVSMYDGYSFTNYGIENGLTDNTNFEIIKDDKGWLWFTAYNGTLSYYDGERINPARINDQLQELNIKNWIEQIIQLSEDKYLLIPFTFVSYELYRDDGHINIYEYDMSSNTIELVDGSTFDTLISEGDNKILYSEKYKVGIDEMYPAFFPYQPNDTVTYIGRDLENRDKGLFFNTKVLYNKSTLYNKTNELYTTETHLQGNNLYLSTKSGLTEINLDSKSKNNTILEGDYITKFLKGPQNNYWISTQDNGVYFIPSLAIKKYKTALENFDPVKLRVWNDHLVITARNEQGLMVINKKLERVLEEFQVENLSYGWSKPSEDKLHFCNLDYLSYQAETNSFKFNSNITLNENNTFAIFRECIHLGNEKWYCPTLTSIVKVDSKNQKSKSGKTIDFSIESSYKHDDNYNYIGTSKGLKRYKEPEVIEDLSELSPFYSWKINNIISIGSGYEKEILMSTLGFGLIYTKNLAVTPQLIDTNSGISSNTINVIKVQNDSILWIGSTKGLDRVNYSLTSDSLIINSISNITKSHGLASDYILDIAFWNGEIWTTTKSGISHFNFDDLDLRAKKPMIYLDKLIVNHIEIDNLSDNLKFAHDENNIEIHYTGISYTKPDGAEFYKTVFTKNGKDTIETLTDNRDAQFIDLTPGSYTFQVQASDNKGQYTESAIKLEFKIEKHYSQTSWFRLLVLLGLALTMYFLYKSRERTLLKRSQEKEELQETKLQLKAAELNALRNQMNPHFIYNALNSIQNYIFKGDPEKANYLLSRFGKLMRSSLKLSGLEYITIETELNFLKNYLELEQMRFENQFTYKIDIEHQEILSYKIPPLLLQPLLENSIKHGIEAQKDGQLLIEIKEDNKYIIITIEDNGKGYIPNTQVEREGPTALKIIRERISIINKDAQVASSFDLRGINTNSKTGTRATINLAKTNK